MGPCGYRSPAYLAAAARGARLVPLGPGQGALVARPVPGTGHEDLTGPYPFLRASDWPAAIDALPARGALALTLVTDPFCPLALADLAPRFDVARALDEHTIVDLAGPPAPSRHHRRKLRAAPAGLALDLRVPGPVDAAAFAGLYANLVARKGIADARAMDPEALRAQALVPGALAVVARLGGALAGMDLYYVDEGRAHAHLSAYSEAGYAASVSYPMMAFAIEALADHASLLSLGGAPAAGGEGVRHFKRGWSRETRPSLLLGRVLDRPAYEALCGPPDGGGYFPAYRAGEFAPPRLPGRRARR